MQKIFLRLFVMAASILFSFTGAYGAENLRPVALQKLQNAVVKALPVETDIVRIAVLDFEGDDGTVKGAVTSAITEKTTFRVIEREDLDKILDEQGLQLKDIMDEKTRIEHGRIKGVQGLLMGRMLGEEKGFLSYTIRVYLKLDDVEKGEIIFARDFIVTGVSPWRERVIIGGLVCLVLIFFLISLAKSRASVKVARIQQDVSTRVDLSKEIGKALTNLSGIKTKLMDKGKTDEAVALKDAERDLGLLKDLVESAARGSADKRSKKEFKELIKFDEKMMNYIQDLTKSTEKMGNRVMSDDADNLGKEIEFLNRDIKNVTNEFKGRKF